MVAVELVRAVELFAHVFRDGVVQSLFKGRKAVIHRIGAAFREERRTVEFQQVFFDQTPHNVGNVDRLSARPRRAFKSVGVDQRHEEVELLLFAVVRRRRQKQEVTRDIGEESAQ